MKTMHVIVDIVRNEFLCENEKELYFQAANKSSNKPLPEKIIEFSDEASAERRLNILHKHSSNDMFINVRVLEIKKIYYNG